MTRTQRFVLAVSEAYSGAKSLFFEMWCSMCQAICALSWWCGFTFLGKRIALCAKRVARCHDGQQLTSCGRIVACCSVCGKWHEKWRSDVVETSWQAPTIASRGLHCQKTARIAVNSRQNRDKNVISRIKSDFTLDVRNAGSSRRDTFILDSESRLHVLSDESFLNARYCESDWMLPGGDTFKSEVESVILNVLAEDKIQKRWLIEV